MPGDAAPSRPTTLRPSAAMLAAQRAILHCVPRALALGPGRSRQRATPRRVWPCALRCHHRNAHLHHLRAFRAMGTALAAAGGGAEAQQGPAVARRPPRGCAAQVHQLALIWRPGKGTEDAHFLGRNPGAICGHRDQELFPQTAHAVVLPAQICFLSSILGPQMSRFRGVQVVLPITRNIAVRKASNL